MATFLGAKGVVIARRIGMSLTTKTGVEYKVFSREDWVERPPRTILRREQSSDYDALTLLNEICTADTQ